MDTTEGGRFSQSCLTPRSNRTCRLSDETRKQYVGAVTFVSPGSDGCQNRSGCRSRRVPLWSLSLSDLDWDMRRRGSYGSITRTSTVDDEGGMSRAGGATCFPFPLISASTAGSLRITALSPDCLKNQAFSDL